MGGAASGMTVNGFIYHLPEKNITLRTLYV